MTFPSILVVEDHEPFRRFIRLELQKRTDFRLIGEASDGLKAVKLAKELQPDLILLDIGLEGLNGIEAARGIRTVAPNARLLFVSLESSPEVVEETFRLGAHGYVHKQRAYRDLLPAIDTVLEDKQFVSEELEFKDATEAQAPRRHEIVFCADQSIALDRLTDFMAAALLTGNAAIVWTKEPHRDSILERLRKRGVDIDAAVQAGTYIASDAAETPDLIRMLQAITGLSEAASKAGKRHPRVAVCGERAGCLWAEGKTDEAIRLEQLCNELAQKSNIEILCTYPSPEGREKDHALKTICAEHTAVIR